MSITRGGVPPILAQKYYTMPSAFTPENLLREARRQKQIGRTDIPAICVLDPDGDMVRRLLACGDARLDPTWACYHTQLYRFSRDEIDFGIVGCAVGASFAVLIAEELFASGCKLLISVTSSGQIVPTRRPPYFIIIDRAWRDEGTSYHYLAASDYAYADATLIAALDGSFDRFAIQVLTGATWTTDAPFRELNPRLTPCVKWIFWPSKWKRRRFMHSPKSGGSPFFVLPTSPIRWVESTVTLRKEKRTVPRTHWI